MSKTHTAYPIVAATLAAHRYLEAVKPWQTTNEVQKIFLRYYEDMNKEISSFKEIETRVSKLADELNAFLKEKGFTIELNQFSPNEFGVVSILNVLVEWLETGHKTKVYLDNDYDKPYDAVQIEADTGGVKVFRKEGYEFPIARLATKTDDVVYIAIADKELESFELADKIRELSTGLAIDFKHDDIIFPMVDLNQQVDIGWLKDMWTTSYSYSTFCSSSLFIHSKLSLL